MKCNFALEFSDAAEGAAVFEELAEAFRRLSGGLKRAASAVVNELIPDGASDTVGETAADSTETGKRKRRTKAEMEAARAAEAAGQPATAASPAAPAETLPEDHLLESLRETGNQVINTKGPETVMDILKAYGAKKYPDVPRGSRAELLGKLKAALA